MKIIVTSDSHGFAERLENVYAVDPSALFIFLGDGERDFDRLSLEHPQMRGLMVAGNCDYASMCPGILTLNLDGGHSLIGVHGHIQDVKRGLDPLLYLAKQYGADIALFGHTHMPCHIIRDGIHLLNPGAIIRGSYAIIDVSAAGINISHEEI